MGRNKKYHTKEEQQEAKRARWKQWYEKNKQSLNNKRMEDYYEGKLKDIQEELSKLRKGTDL
jgi:hypothetical protein